MKTKQEILDNLYSDGNKLLENIKVAKMVGDWQLVKMHERTLDYILTKIERLKNGNIHKS